jgi:exonuclease SbcD
LKLIHTSDWHFGMSVGTATYEADQRFFLEQMYDLIRREQVEAVLCSGDVYDSSVANADAIRLFNEVATKLCLELGTKFIVIAGNHDSAARLASCRELLRGAGMFVTGRLERDIEPVLLDGGKVAVYSLPFFGRDEVTALYPEKADEIRSVETAMQVVCDGIRQKMDKTRRNILLSHALIVDAEISDSDRSARVGFATAISKDVFHDFDYVALGHIHKPQVIAPHIRYSGSPVKYSFGTEEKQTKGVVLVDTDTMDQQFVPFKPLRDRKSVEGTYEELIQRMDLQDDYLRLRVTDRFVGLELQAEMRQRFPYLLEISGMSLAENESAAALSVEALQEMDETDIMLQFFGEHFQYTPTPEQLELFRDVLAWSEEEME